MEKTSLMVFCHTYISEGYKVILKFFELNLLWLGVFRVVMYKLEDIWHTDLAEMVKFTFTKFTPKVTAHSAFQFFSDDTDALRG
jgi:hypothetical protein